MIRFKKAASKIWEAALNPTKRQQFGAGMNFPARLISKRGK